MLNLKLIFQSIVFESEVLLQSIAPSRLHIVMHDVVVKVHIRALLILFISELGLLMPLQFDKQ